MPIVSQTASLILKTDSTMAGYTAVGPWEYDANRDLYTCAFTNTGSIQPWSIAWQSAATNVWTVRYEWAGALIATAEQTANYQAIEVHQRAEDDPTWQRWNGEYYERVMTAAMTEDEQREWRRRNEDRARRAQEAKDKAKQLFLNWLTPEQRAEFERHSHFHVLGKSGRRYRIRASEAATRHGNIDELDRSGQVVARLCCAPEGDIPHFDAIIGQRVALEWDEKDFRKKANITPVVAGYRAA